MRKFLGGKWNPDPNSWVLQLLSADEHFIHFFCLLSRQYLCASFSKYIKFEKQCRVIYDKHMLLLIFSSVTEKCRLTEGRKSISLLHYRISIPYIYVWEWRIILPFSKIAWQSFSCEFAVDKNWCLYIDKHSWTINPWEWGKFVF